MGVVNDTEFMRWLKGKREAFGWSQTRMAINCGFHPTYANKLERGKITATYEAVEAVCTAFGVGPVERVYIFLLAGYLPREYGKTMRNHMSVALRIYNDHMEVVGNE